MADGPVSANPLERALQAMDLQLQAISAAEQKITALAQTPGVNLGYLESQLQILNARASDIRRAQDSLVQAGTAPYFPSPDEVLRLREAVRRLQLFNVLAANVNGFMEEVANLIGIVAAPSNSTLR